ncbi:hypothetical protein [Pedobacter sp. NJ-S-72]
MEDHQIDNSQIQLQENIPLTEEEIKQMETEQKVFMRVAVITLIVGIFFLVIIPVLSVNKETLDDLKYYDYIAFSCIGLMFYSSFCYFFAGLVYRLTSVVINRDETEHAECLTFFDHLIMKK